MDNGIHGELLDINTYNQPGVEAGKLRCMHLLGWSGFDERKKELESKVEVESISDLISSCQISTNFSNW